MVRAALHSRAQKIRSAQSSTVFIYGSHVRTRVCLTPMPRVGASWVWSKRSGNTTRRHASGRPRPPPHGQRAACLGLRMSSTAALRLPSRVRRAVHPIEWFACNPIVIGWRTFLCARWSGMKMVKRMSATLVETRKLAPAAAGRWFASLGEANKMSSINRTELESFWTGVTWTGVT